MLSNLISQLKQAGKEDKYYDVLAEIPRVRKDFGYPPLVTPSSQIVGTQAVMNVIMGERYKTFPKESQRHAARANTASCPARSTRRSAPRRASPLRMSSPVVPPICWSRSWRSTARSSRVMAKSDEDVLSLALFPQVAPKFIEKRDHARCRGARSSRGRPRQARR